MIRILIVDDHPILREGLAALIGTQPDMRVAGEAADGVQALAAFEHLAPDLVVMDLRLPAMSGVDAIIAIRAHDPGARVVVLTSYDADEDVHRAFEAGASGYLLKDMHRQYLLQALRTVHAGGRVVPPEVQARLDARGSYSALSARELDVLKLVVHGRTNREIAMVLAISENTVKVHVRSILAKLGANDRTHAVTTALQHGIIQLD